MKRIRNTETGHTFDYDEERYPKLEVVVKRGGGCAGLACESCLFFNRDISSLSAYASICKVREELGNATDLIFANCIVEDIPIKPELRFITVEELRQLELPAKCICRSNGEERTLIYVGEYKVMFSNKISEFSESVAYATKHNIFHMPVVEPPKVKLTIDGIDIMISKDSADEIKKQLTKGDSNE